MHSVSLTSSVGAKRHRLLFGKTHGENTLRSLFNWRRALARQLRCGSRSDVAGQEPKGLAQVLRGPIGKRKEALERRSRDFGKLYRGIGEQSDEITHDQHSGLAVADDVMER